MGMTDTDTIIWKQNLEIIIQNDSNGINMQLVDPDNSYIQVYEKQYGMNSKSTRWDISEHVNIPFSNFVVTKKKKKVKKNFETHWAGFGFGFVNACDDGLNIINSSNSNGVSMNWGKSYELSFNILDFDVPLIGNNFGMVMGFGLNWRNYVLNGNRMLTYEHNKVMIETLSDDSSVKKSRIKRFDLVVPIMLEWNFGKDFYLIAGPEVCFNTRTSIKNVYNYSDNLKDNYKRGIASNPVTVDLTARIGCEFIGLYAKYSPTKIFQYNQGPEMRSFSIGMYLPF